MNSISTYNTKTFLLTVTHGMPSPYFIIIIDLVYFFVLYNLLHHVCTLSTILNRVLIILFFEKLLSKIVNKMLNMKSLALVLAAASHLPSSRADYLVLDVSPGDQTCAPDNSEASVMIQVISE